jgi:hypothetical protein
MELERLKELVESYHFDLRTEAHKDIQTNIVVGFVPFPDMPNKPEGASALQARIEFTIAFNEFVLQGAVSQINVILNRIIEKETDISQEEVQLLVEPLFVMINRLTYEVTEIAFDQPGIEINFASGPTPQD